MSDDKMNRGEPDRSDNLVLPDGRVLLRRVRAALSRTH